MRVCRNTKFRHTLLSCVRLSKMQGTEMEDKNVAKSEFEEQRYGLLIMPQRHVVLMRRKFAYSK